MEKINKRSASCRPHPVDLVVGESLRKYRKGMRMSQEAVSGQIGITFQQLQKYERATNRISASKLYEISKVLAIPISCFFEDVEIRGFENCNEHEMSVSNEGFLSSVEGVELARGVSAIKRSAVREKLVQLVISLADDS